METAWKRHWRYEKLVLKASAGVVSNGKIWKVHGIEESSITTLTIDN